MKAVELKELQEDLVSDDTLIPVVNPDGFGRASLKEVRGLGLSGQETFFLVTSKSSGITTDSGGWREVPQTTTVVNRYLWSYTRFTYTDGKTIATPPAIIGVYGDTGPQGIPGVKGDTGEPFAIARTYPSIADMNDGYDSDGVRVGSFVVIDTGNINDEDNAKLFLRVRRRIPTLQTCRAYREFGGRRGRRGFLDHKDRMVKFHPMKSSTWCILSDRCTGRANQPIQQLCSVGSGCKSRTSLFLLQVTLTRQEQQEVTPTLLLQRQIFQAIHIVSLQMVLCLPIVMD